MKKNIEINPIGLKGNEVINEMKRLMGIKPLITENTTNSNSVIELTKVGPDNKVYGIVREKHEFYIKVADKKDNIIAEDFQYIGGLKNKKSEMYETYAKAIKHLNLKFISINESLGKSEKINVFENDNVVKENTFAGGLGFVKEEDITEEKTKNNPWAICTASVGREDKEKYEACVMGVKKEKGIKEDLTEEMYSLGDDVELTENEQAIDGMKDKEYGVKEAVKESKKHKMSILDSISEDNMDNIINSTTVNEDKLKNILNTLSEAELNKLLSLKKKI